MLSRHSQLVRASATNPLYLTDHVDFVFVVFGSINVMVSLISYYLFDRIHVSIQRSYGEGEYLGRKIIKSILLLLSVAPNEVGETAYAFLMVGVSARENGIVHE